MGVLSQREIEARYEIELENYVKKVQIESRVVGDLAQNHVISTAIKYQTRLVQTAKSLIDLGLTKEAEPVIQIIKEISSRVATISTLVEQSVEARKYANNLPKIEEMAAVYSTDVKQYSEKIRVEVDKLELVIDDEDWPLVKYRELLYVR